MQESDMAFNFLEFHNKNKNPDPLRLSLKGASHDKKRVFWTQDYSSSSRNDFL